MIMTMNLVITEKNITNDWSLRESIQVKLRINVKKIPRKYGHLFDRREKATITVLEQVKVLSYKWYSYIYTCINAENL